MSLFVLRAEGRQKHGGARKGGGERHGVALEELPMSISSPSFTAGTTRFCNTNRSIVFNKAK
jgi:hypothetical protein